MTKVLDQHSLKIGQVNNFFKGSTLSRLNDFCLQGEAFFIYLDGMPKHYGFEITNSIRCRFLEGITSINKLE